jgi:predicted RNase H-like HicB family nuclease
MNAARILHHHEPPYGWWFESPDLPGLTGSASTYVESQARAESAARFHLECVADEQGESPPGLAALEFEHFVPASEAPALAA